MALLVASGSTVAAERWLLPDAFPSQVEHGLQLMRNTALQQAMQAYEKAPEGSQLLILHGKAAEQRGLAAELRDWLMVLGMDEQQLTLKLYKKLKQQLALQVEEP